MRFFIGTVTGVALVIASSAFAQGGAGDDLNLCLSRASGILSSLDAARMWSVIAAVAILASVLLLIYILCQWWVRGGWFQTLLAILLPLATCLIVFHALTRTTLGQGATGGENSIGAFPTATCRDAERDASAADKARLRSVFALQQAGAPFWVALGLWPPGVVLVSSITTVGVLLVVTHRKVVRRDSA
jgi:hypothetical protein